MKVLYVGLLYNYGKKEEGFSYEHFNLEAGFDDCATKGMFDVTYLYPDASENYEASVNELILNGDIDAIFHVAFNESLDLPNGSARLALKKDIPVLQWDCDSSWRFPTWIAPRRDRVSHFITTHSVTTEWYQKAGMKVIRSQWGGSPLYVPNAVPKVHDVSFIGQKHGQKSDGTFVRADVIDAIMNAGIKIDLFGSYWDGYPNWGGYITDFNKVLDVFNGSKICLNLSNPWHVGTMPQIKGRHFEIPQIGGFQICTPADDLTSYFVDGQEIVIATSLEDLIDKLKYYLVHDNEREQIAYAGRRRMLRDHQWANRFEHIFKEIGLLV